MRYNAENHKRNNDFVERMIRLNHVLKYLEWLVFVLYCAIPLSLVGAVIVQESTLFMNTVFGFGFAYFAYGVLLQHRKQEA